MVAYNINSKMVLVSVVSWMFAGVHVCFEGFLPPQVNDLKHLVHQQGGVVTDMLTLSVSAQEGRFLLFFLLFVDNASCC